MLYDLFFTPERMVAIIIQSPDDIRPNTDWWTSVTGGWFLKHKEQQMLSSIAKERRQQSQTLSLDDLITVNPHNFQIRYEDISIVELKHNAFQDQIVFHLAKSIDRRPRVVFNLKKEQIPVVKLTIEKILPAKIKSS